MANNRCKPPTMGGFFRFSDTRARQRGFVFMAELSLGLIAAVAALAIAMIYWKNAREDDRAIRAGQELSQMTSAVAEWMAYNSNDSAVLPDGSTLNQNGVAWLKATTCPGGTVTNPVNGFLPCDFGVYPGGFSTPLFANYTTTITRNGSAVQSAITYIPIMPGNDNRRLGHMAGVISKTAQELGSSAAIPALTSYRTYHSNISVATAISGNPYQIPANVATTPDFGRVIAVISDQTNNDIWLRVDGGNMMLAALRMNGNDMVGARNIGASGTVVVTDGTPGNAEGVVIADNVAIMDSTLPSGDNPMVSQGVYYMDVVATGATIQKPTCPTGSAPQIFTLPQSMKRTIGGQVFPIHAHDINLTDTGAGWRIDLRILSTDGTGVGSWGAADADSKIVVATKCL